MTVKSRLVSECFIAALSAGVWACMFGRMTPMRVSPNPVQGLAVSLIFVLGPKWLYIFAAVVPANEPVLGLPHFVEVVCLDFFHSLRDHK